MSLDKGRRSNEEIREDKLFLLEPVARQLDEDLPWRKVLAKAAQRIHYTEKQYRAVVEAMHKTLNDYLDKNPNDPKVKDLLASRFDNEEFQSFRKGERPEKGLITARTLKRTVENIRASTTTLHILRAYWQAEKVLREAARGFRRQMDRISGVYLELAVHSTSAGKFQISVINILSEGSAITRYLDHRGIEQSRKLELELLGNTGVLLTEKTEESIIVFYLYIGPEPFSQSGEQERVPKHDSLQGVYIYSNKDGNTTANLATYYRITEKEAKGAGFNDPDQFFKLYVPTREQETLEKLDELPGFKDSVDPLFKTRTVRENIQYFLHQRATAISTLRDNGKPFDFSQKMAPHPGPLHQEARFYQQYQRLIGEYFFYINERFPAKILGEQRVESHAMFSTVARGTMRIKAEEASGALLCELRLLRSDEEPDIFYQYRGYISNHRLSNSNFLVTTLYLEPNKDRCIQLLFTIIDKNRLVGGFNFAYLQIGEIGSGIIIAIRQELIHLDALHAVNHPEHKKPVTFDKVPKRSEDESKTITPNLEETVFFNYLSAIPRSVISAPSLIEMERYRDTLYSGVYRVFTPALPPGSSFHTCLLVIYRNGSVYYVDRERVAHGRLEQPSSNTLNIILREEEDGILGFLCIRVNNLDPNDQASNHHPCYLASFAGFQRSGNQNPVAAHVLLEYLEKYISPDLEQNINNKDSLDAFFFEKKEIDLRIEKFFLEYQPHIMHYDRPIYSVEDLTSLED